MTYTITGPGEYWTRNGAKQRIDVVSDGMAMETNGLYWSSETGRFMGDREYGSPSPHDIVGPWRDEPQQAAIRQAILGDPSSPHKTAAQAKYEQPVTPPRGLVEYIRELCAGAMPFLAERASKNSAQGDEAMAAMSHIVNAIAAANEWLEANP
jgi:hypothetical protein